MANTKLLYFEDFNLLTSDALVLQLIQENGKTVIILDQTIFYPQGGGQPYDQGIIESPTGKFLVEEVRYVDGLVKHIGKFEFPSSGWVPEGWGGFFEICESVKCLVDETRRILNSRLHSAGHVLDMAITNLKINWIPGKGYHFPDGPYVEYAGSLEGLDKENLKTDIENLCNKFILDKIETKLLFTNKEKMKEVCHFVPEYIPEGKPARVVMYGEFGVPCGGTHVNNLSEIRSMIIRKIKNEGNNIRVAYNMVR